MNDYEASPDGATGWCRSGTEFVLGLVARPEGRGRAQTTKVGRGG